MGEAEKTKREEDFETWVTFIPDQVNELKKQLPIGDALDFSIASLDELESFLLSHYSKELLKQPENKYLLDRIARYVGTVLTQNIPEAYWDIELENEKDVFFGLPVVKVKNAVLAPFGPFSMVTAIFSRNKGNFLSTTIEKSRKRLISSS